jgi:hypothetical protein
MHSSNIKLLLLLLLHDGVQRHCKKKESPESAALQGRGCLFAACGMLAACSLLMMQPD